MKNINILLIFFSFLWLAGCIEEKEIDYDITKPEINVDQSVYQTVRSKGETFQITGNLTDETGLLSLRIFSTKWGIDKTVEIGGKSYTLAESINIPDDADLSERNVISLEVLDSRKNKSTADILVNFGTDATAPVIEIVAPTEAVEVYTGITLDLDINVSDNFALENITVKADELNFNRQVFGAGSASYHFVAKGDEGGVSIPVSVTPGEYDVSITANDMAGNVTTVTKKYKVIETPITYTTIGIIGNATPKGWGESTPMRLLDAADVHKWVIIAKLSVGEMKFRANNAWTVNWGAAVFPAGNGTQDGPNIPVTTAGYYKITFNDRSGAYTFEELNPAVYTTVGIIGNATPGGWGASTAMVKDANDPHLWTLTVTLTAGEGKFRADNDWAVNWGAATFPSGVGTQGGPNIPVAAGAYKVTFNDVSGEYSFELQALDAIYLVGDATPAGWSNTSYVSMFRDPSNGLRFTYTGKLVTGNLKFLKIRGQWQPQWGKGSADGVLGYNGGSGSDPDAIAIASTGYYTVTFDAGAMTYSVTPYNEGAATTYTTIGVIGSATPDDWNSDVNMTQVSGDPHQWYIDGQALTAEELKFRANDAWTVNWGNSTFPYGVGTNGGSNIPVTPAGDYLIRFCDLTGEYAVIKK